MTPEQLLMLATPQAIELRKDVIATASTGTKCEWSIDDVALALAGLRGRGAERISATLEYTVLGNEPAGAKVARYLLQEALRLRVRSNWPEPARRPRTVTRMAGLAVLEAARMGWIWEHVRPAWFQVMQDEFDRDLARAYFELRDVVIGWERIGLHHVRQRLNETND